MKTLSNKAFRHAALVAAFVVATSMLLPPIAAAQGGNRGSHRLSGTWHVQVALKNCESGAPLGPPFSSLLSFADGGSFSGTTLNPAFQPGQRTSDFGSWAYAGQGRYTAVSEAFIQFNSAATVPPSPSFRRGTQRIEQVITVDDDSFTAIATVHFLDVTNTEYMSACANATGKRFQ